MKVLVIADDSPANHWILTAIETQHAVSGILRPDWSAERPPRREGGTPSPHVPRSTAQRLLRRVRSRYFAALDSAHRAQVAHALFPTGARGAIRAPVAQVSAWDFHAASTEALVRAANPDLLLVSGAPMLRANIYGIPRLGAINLHLGISPAYRGMHTLDTPWQLGDYARIGATAHYIDDGVDTGPVLFRVYPTISPHDTLARVEANLVRGVATALVEFLAWLGAQQATAPVPGRVLAEPGRLIRFHDRRIGDHLRCQLRRLTSARPPLLGERVEQFYREAEPGTAI